MEAERTLWMQFVRKLAIPEWHYECVVVDNEIFLLGYDDQLKLEELKVLVFNTRNHSVLSVPRDSQKDQKKTAPFLKSFFAVAHNRKIYVCGHEDPNYFSAEQVHCLNTETMEWSSKKAKGLIPFGKLWGKAGIITGKIFILVEEMEKRVSCVYSLDLSTFCWGCERILTWPEPLTPRGTTIFGNRMYILFVKWANFQNNNDCMGYYDAKEGVWEWLDSPGFRPFCGPRWTTFDYRDCLFAFISNISLISPGYTLKAHDPKNDSETPRIILQYCTQGNEWKRVNYWGAPPGRYFYSVAVVGSTAFFFCSIFKEIFMIDFNPSLQNLCYQAICRHKLDVDILPTLLQKELSLFSMKCSK